MRSSMDIDPSVVSLFLSFFPVSGFLVTVGQRIVNEKFFHFFFQ